MNFWSSLWIIYTWWLYLFQMNGFEWLMVSVLTTLPSLNPLFSATNLNHLLWLFSQIGSSQETQNCF